MEHWYTLQTKPRKEHMVRDLLENRQIQTFFPTLAPGGRRSSHPAHEQPFFARYLFARLDLDTVPLSSINWMQGMTGVVSFGGQPAMVQEEVIRWLRSRLAQLDAHDYYAGLPLVPGARMRVIAGPLKGMEAVFDRRRTAEDRARVLVQLLGRLTACEIPLSWLESL